MNERDTSIGGNTFEKQRNTDVSCFWLDFYKPTLFSIIIHRVIYAWKILIKFKLPIWYSKNRKMADQGDTFLCWIGLPEWYQHSRFYSRETDIYSAQAFTACGSDPSQNFMDTGKTVDLTRLCIQINNTVVFFFQSYAHQTYKVIQSKKTCNG